MFAMGDTMDSLEAALLTLRHLLDTALWAMIAVWFLHVYLYGEERITKRSLHIATNFTISLAMVKALSSILFLICYIKPDGWSAFFSIVEIIMWMGLFVYMVYLWHCAYTEYKQLQKHKQKGKQYYTLEDEAERRLNQ